MARHFFTVVDESFVPWIARRDTASKVLLLLDPDEPQVRPVVNSRAVRAGSVLALIGNRPDTARALIASYEYGLGDDAERLALFERQLADRFPAYGPLQRS